MIRLVMVTSFTCVGILFCQNTIAQTIVFELQGSAGSGVTAANEPNDEVIDGGSGDVGPTGISLNLSTGILSVDVEWGSGNGHTNLSSDIDFMNIHGPTTEFGFDNFFESADTFSGLDGFDASAVNGSYVGDTSFNGNLSKLLEGRYYLHLHTFTNGGGEARGYFIPEVILGDVNDDQQINLLDVGPFIDAITDGDFIDEADINRDGQVNLLDVDPFVSILAG